LHTSSSWPVWKSCRRTHMSVPPATNLHRGMEFPLQHGPDSAAPLLVQHAFGRGTQTIQQARAAGCSPHDAACPRCAALHCPPTHLPFSGA
jgi:hypothetical protein